MATTLPQSERQIESVRRSRFYPHIPAHLLKDRTLSDAARFLWCVLAAFADGRSHETYVSAKTLRACTRWGRSKLEAAERELIKRRLLVLTQQHAKGGRFGGRIFRLSEPASAGPVLEK